MITKARLDKLEQAVQRRALTVRGVVTIARLCPTCGEWVPVSDREEPCDQHQALPPETVIVLPDNGRDP